MYVWQVENLKILLPYKCAFFESRTVFEIILTFGQILLFATHWHSINFFLVKYKQFSSAPKNAIASEVDVGSEVPLWTFFLVYIQNERQMAPTLYCKEFFKRMLLRVYSDCLRNWRRTKMFYKKCLGHVKISK